MALPLFPPGPEQTRQALLERYGGSARQGTVDIRAFDRGVKETLGAVSLPTANNQWHWRSGLGQ